MKSHHIALRDEISSVWGSSPTGAPEGVRGLKSLRDYLSHGGQIEDSSETLSRSLSKYVKQVDGALIKYLSSGTIEASLGTLLWHQNSSLTVSVPFVQVRGDGSLVAYSGGGALNAKFQSLGSSPRPRLENVDVEWEDGLFAIPTPRSYLIDIYRESIRNDVLAFSENGLLPVFLDDQEESICYSWSRAVSDGVESREDHFRLGPDENREWRDDNHSWVPYRNFLKSLVNWRVTASRLAQSFASVRDSYREGEAQYMPPLANPEANIDARASVREQSGVRGREIKIGELFSEVDESSSANVGRTLITFIDGDAGTGKTRAMLGAALHRAHLVANSEADLPLLLYASSTGRVLDNLEIVVEAAVSRTLNLTVERVKALSRNGLMVLLVDGFDELLGNASYGDALGSLRPWITDLGGRGSLVLSARTSYFQNQYQHSLAKRPLPVPVRHRSAELLPWSEQDLREYLVLAGGREEIVEHLSGSERIMACVPIFARILAGLTVEDVRKAGFSLPQVLLSGYLEREVQKLCLDIGEDNSLLTVDELFRIMESVASLMSGEVRREVGLEDLELAAEDALPGGLEGRQGLRLRLTTLCGISVDSRQDDLKFSFKHEVLFDEFLAGSIARAIADENLGEIAASMSCEPWRPSMVRATLRLVGVNCLRQCAIDVASRRHTVSDSAVTNFDRSLGAVWSILFENGL